MLGLITETSAVKATTTLESKRNRTDSQRLTEPYRRSELDFLPTLIVRTHLPTSSRAGLHSKGKALAVIIR